MKQVFFLLVAGVLLASCNSADSNVDEIADTYCACFKSTDKKASKKVKSFYKMVADGKSQEKLQAEAQELSADEREFVQQLSSDMEGKTSKLYKCIDKADKEVEKFRTKDKDAFMDKLVDEMYSRSDCKLAAHVFKAGVRIKKKGGDEEEETTDEDEDKNKDDEEEEEN